MQNTTIIFGVDKVHNDGRGWNVVTGIDYTVIEAMHGEYDYTDIFILLEKSKEFREKINKASKKYKEIIIINLEHNEDISYISDYTGVIFSCDEEDFFLDCMEHTYRVYSEIMLENGNFQGYFEE